MEQPAARPRPHWGLLAVILLAFLLRVYGLGQHELWFDEALSAVISAKGLAGILSYTQTTSFEHPPLYYFGLYGWMGVGGSTAFALRFFSLFWSVLLIPLLYRLMTSFGGHRFAFLAAFVTAVSIKPVVHSQNARMYTLTMFLGVLSMVLFLVALRRKKSKWWIAYLLVCAAGVAVHYYLALLLLVPAVLLFLAGTRYRRLLFFMLAALVVGGVLVAAWLWLAPGPRQSLQQTLVRFTGATSLLERIQHSVGDVFLEPPAVGHVLLGLVALLGTLFWPLAPPPPSSPVSVFGSRRFLVVWITVPLLAALAIPYWLQDRHLAYVWPALYALVACGLLVLRKWGRGAFAAGLALLLVTSGWSLYLERTDVDFEFGRIMAFIEQRARSDDLVIMSQEAFWPFEEYYAKRGLSVEFVPSEEHPLDWRFLRPLFEEIVAEHPRIWLGPVSAWTGDPDHVVERWLAQHTYQAYKEWWPGSGSSALYFTTPELEALPLQLSSDWEGRFRLKGIEVWPPRSQAHGDLPAVVAGDALRMSLTWQPGDLPGSAHAVGLYLVDEEGIVLAERRSEPCSGECPTQAWDPSKPVEDHHALLVPPGTPPGRYRVQVGWFSLDEARELELDGWGTRAELLDIMVVRPAEDSGAEQIAPSVQHALHAEFGDGVVLVGYDLPQDEISATGTLEVDLFWQVLDQPAEDYDLLVQLVDSHDHVAASWNRPPVSASFPAADWQAGDHLRGIQRLTVPHDVDPGRYHLRLTLLDELGETLPLSGSMPREAMGGLVRWQSQFAGEHLDLATVGISDPPEPPARSPSFDVPPIAQSLDVELDQGVSLLGCDLDPSAATQGGNLRIVLYWQAQGPTDRPYKVFAHLGDDYRQPLAQHDGMPGSGCCPTDTWVDGEVIIDPHVLSLGQTVQPGTYRLSVGMYDEATDERLPVLQAQGNDATDDRIHITWFQVLPSGTSRPETARPDWPQRIYLPEVRRNW